jgi:hypothetical protein
MKNGQPDPGELPEHQPEPDEYFEQNDYWKWVEV